MDTKFIRDRITQLRIQKGVSEYKMSYDLGHSRSYIYNISSGKSFRKTTCCYATYCNTRVFQRCWVKLILNCVGWFNLKYPAKLTMIWRNNSKGPSAFDISVDFLGLCLLLFVERKTRHKHHRYNNESSDINKDHWPVIRNANSHPNKQDNNSQCAKKNLARSFHANLLLKCQTMFV